MSWQHEKKGFIHDIFRRYIRKDVCVYTCDECGKIILVMTYDIHNKEIKLHKYSNWFVEFFGPCTYAKYKWLYPIKKYLYIIRPIDLIIKALVIIKRCVTRLK